MGSITSRQNAAVEETDNISSNHAYKYPPKSGTFHNVITQNKEKKIKWQKKKEQGREKNMTEDDGKKKFN